MKTPLSPPPSQVSFSGKLPPRKPKNAAVRPREFLTEAEVESLIDAAAAQGRHGHRDATMILLCYRHGLRVSELIALRWDMVDLKQSLLHVTRRKHGMPSTHPLRGPELRSLRRLQRDYPETAYVFVTERRSPMTDSTFRKLLARAGRAAHFPFLVHPHMLRHATGYKLANDGQDTRAIGGPVAHGQKTALRTRQSRLSSNICFYYKYL